MKIKGFQLSVAQSPLPTRLFNDSKMSKDNTANKVRIEIADFGNINVNLAKRYDKGMLKNLAMWLQFAFEKWEAEVVRIETLKNAKR